MKTIVLVDPLSGGHHEAYMCIFTRVLLETDYKVIAILPESKKLKNWALKELPTYQAHFSVLEYTKSTKTFKDARFSEVLKTYEKWSNIKKILISINTNTSIDHVFFACFDYYLANNLPKYIIDLIFPFKWSGLYFHPRHMRLDSTCLTTKTSWRAIDGIAASKNCTGIAIHDEGIVDTFSRRLSKPVILFPEMADTTSPLPFHQDTNSFKGKANNRKIVGMFGTLSPHQGIMELIQLINQSNPKKFFFVIAGPLKMESFSIEEQQIITNFLEELPENCYLKLDYLQEGAEFNTFVNDVDIVYIVYNNFPSASNRLTKAAIFKKPVLSSKRFCVGEDVTKYKLGKTVTEGNISEYITALEKCAEHDFKDSDFEYYAALHHEDKLQQKFKTLIS